MDGIDLGTDTHLDDHYAWMDVTVVVDGAVDRELVVGSFDQLLETMREISEAAKADGLPTQVYVLEHEHAFGPCECAQYAQDHKPYWEWNVA